MNDIQAEIGRLDNTINDLVSQWTLIESNVRRGMSADPRRDGWVAIELRSKTARIRAMRNELEARIAKGRTHEPLPYWWTEI